MQTLSSVLTVGILNEFPSIIENPDIGTAWDPVIPWGRWNKKWECYFIALCRILAMNTGMLVLIKILTYSYEIKCCLLDWNSRVSLKCIIRGKGRKIFLLGFPGLTIYAWNSVLNTKFNLNIKHWNELLTLMLYEPTSSPGNSDCLFPSALTITSAHTAARRPKRWRVTPFTFPTKRRSEPMSCYLYFGKLMFDLL